MLDSLVGFVKCLHLKQFVFVCPRFNQTYIIISCVLFYLIASHIHTKTIFETMFE